MTTVTTLAVSLKPPSGERMGGSVLIVPIRKLLAALGNPHMGKWNRFMMDDRAQRVADAIKQRTLKTAPVVIVTRNADGTERIRILDGRRRLMLLFAAGAENVAVTMLDGGAKILADNGW